MKISFHVSIFVLKSAFSHLHRLDSFLHTTWYSPFSPLSYSRNPLCTPSKFFYHFFHCGQAPTCWYSFTFIFLLHISKPIHTCMTNPIRRTYYKLPNCCLTWSLVLLSFNVIAHILPDNQSLPLSRPFGLTHWSRLCFSSTCQSIIAVHHNVLSQNIVQFFCHL